MQKKTKRNFSVLNVSLQILDLGLKLILREKNNAYANVTEEMQCASCFMDIPANVFIYNTDDEIEDNKKIWQSFTNQNI